MNSKLIENLWKEGTLPTVDTKITLDENSLVKGGLTIGLFAVICVLIVLIYKSSTE